MQFATYKLSETGDLIVTSAKAIIGIDGDEHGASIERFLPEITLDGNRKIKDILKDIQANAVAYVNENFNN